MEKLIEETALLFCDLCKGFNVLSGDCVLGHSPRPCPGSRVPALGAITLILSAVRDGRLDEELGVVGRTPYRARVIWDEWVIKVLGDGATEFIALRKEEEG